MTEKTLCEIQRRNGKGKHYLCGAASFNHNVQPQIEQMKMDLPPVDCREEKWVAESRKQLAASIDLDVGEIDGHILVVFDTQTDKLLTVRAVRLTNDLQISTEEENWSKFIRIPYTADQIIAPQQNDADEGENLVELL